MLGKKKCKMLREIRQQIANENDIPYVTEECRYKGDCKGTCPKCESELRYLEEQLEKRRTLGKRVTVSALAVGMLATATTGCHITGKTELEGDVPYTEELEGEVAYTESGEDVSCDTTEAETLPDDENTTGGSEKVELDGYVANTPEEESNG